MGGGAGHCGSLVPKIRTASCACVYVCACVYSNAIKPVAVADFCR